MLNPKFTHFLKVYLFIVEITVKKSILYSIIDIVVFGFLDNIIVNILVVFTVIFPLIFTRNLCTRNCASVCACTPASTNFSGSNFSSYNPFNLRKTAFSTCSFVLVYLQGQNRIHLSKGS